MRTLEGNKAFPYIAWATVVLFALFTYSLISGIQESTAFLAEKTQETETAMNTYVAIKKAQKEVITADQR